MIELFGIFAGLAVFTGIVARMFAKKDASGQIFASEGKPSKDASAGGAAASSDPLGDLIAREAGAVDQIGALIERETRKPPSELAATLSIRDFIKTREKLVLTVARDPVGLPTVGWGHRTELKLGTKITILQAELFFQEDVTAAVKAIKANVAAQVTQNEFDALVSFVFNVGTSAFAGSTLRRKLNSGDRVGAAGEFARWVFGTRNGVKVRLAGLEARRAQERAIFEGLA